MPESSADDVRLLLRLARGDTARVAAHLAADPGALDRLADTAPAEGLSVVLLRSLHALDLARRLTTGRLEVLDARRRRQVARTSLIVGALIRLADRFAAAGQPFILLKGPYFAERYYADVAGREYVDLDILVPSGDRPRASRLVEAAGYARRSRVIAGERITSAFVHAFDYADTVTGIDLHWRLSRHPWLRIDEGALWAARQPWVIAGRDVQVLSDRDDLVFAALSLLRDIERGRPKARNVLDLILMAAEADAVLDWGALFARGQHDRTFGPLVNVLSLCLDVGDAQDLAPRLAEALARHGSRRVNGRPAGPPCGFAPAAFSLGNKWWSARAHDTNPAAWALWWAVSLPFRLAVHRRLAPRPAGSPHTKR